MRRRAHALRSRYGRARWRGRGIAILTRDVRMNTAPGGAESTFGPGTYVELSGPAANRAYLIAERVKEPGGVWTRLGPFAIVPKGSVRKWNEW